MLSLVEITAFRLKSKSTNESTRIIRGHVVYNSGLYLQITTKNHHIQPLKKILICQKLVILLVLKFITLIFCHKFGGFKGNPYSVIHISTHPCKELCSKMALGEVGVSLP